MIVYADYSISKPRLQAYVVNFTKESRWRACVNAEVVSSHQAQASLKWGQNCQDYKIAAKAQTGHFGSQPAVKMTLAWPKIPSKLKSFAYYVSEYVPGAAYLLGVSQKHKKNTPRQAKVIVSLSSPRTADIVAQLPKMTLFYRALRIPLPVPVRRITQSEILQAPTWNIFAEAPQMLLDSMRGECKVTENRLTTFNGIDLAYAMPENCYHILAHDCSDEMKFMVMLKKSKQGSEHKDMNIKVGHYDISMSYKSGSPEMTLNGVALLESQLPYRSAVEPVVEILKTENGLSILAPEYGIEKINYDGSNVQVIPAVWMKGKTCGVCGRNDDEILQEFHRPDGTVAKDETSHVHSWILPAQTCAEGCNVQQSLVKLEKEIDGEKAKCYSVHPVLKCVKGCSPIKTAKVTTGFHCLPAEATLDLAEGQVSLDKSEDFTELVEAHTSCSCENAACSS